MTLRVGVSACLLGQPVRYDGGHRSGRDLTATMNDYALRRTRELLTLNLSGYVFKARSPSCGLADVPVGGPLRPGTPTHGAGLFAAVITAALPDLPIIEETRLLRIDECRRFIRGVRRYQSRYAAAMPGA